MEDLNSYWGSSICRMEESDSAKIKISFVLNQEEMETEEKEDQC
jgi:hypothetical protein